MEFVTVRYQDCQNIIPVCAESDELNFKDFQSASKFTFVFVIKLGYVYPFFLYFFLVKQHFLIENDFVIKDFRNGTEIPPKYFITYFQKYKNSLILEIEG